MLCLPLPVSPLMALRALREITRILDQSFYQGRPWLPARSDDLHSFMHDLGSRKWGPRAWQVWWSVGIPISFFSFFFFFSLLAYEYGVRRTSVRDFNKTLNFPIFQDLSGTANQMKFSVDPDPKLRGWIQSRSEIIFDFIYVVFWKGSSFWWVDRILAWMQYGPKGHRTYLRARGDRGPRGLSLVIKLWNK